MMINSRADLEALRGTPDFVTALRLIYGATRSWTNAGTAEAPDWQLVEDGSVLTRFDFTPADFGAEIAGMAFATDVPAAPVVSLEAVKAARLAKIAEVKAECNRRVIAIMPEHHQRNTLAAGLMAVTQYGQDLASWPADEKARHDAAMIKWAEIERLRARSDLIEAMRPIPADFADDGYWAAP